MSNTVNAMAQRLKYLSINFLMGAPNFQMRLATRKNLRPLEMRLANTKMPNSPMPRHTPAEMVINL